MTNKDNTDDRGGFIINSDNVDKIKHEIVAVFDKYNLNIVEIELIVNGFKEAMDETNKFKSKLTAQSAMSETFAKMIEKMQSRKDL